MCSSITRRKFFYLFTCEYCFSFYVAALMLWITAWITEHTTHWGLYIDNFWWTAIWAAIVLSIVSWLLSLITRDAGRRVRD